MSNTPFPTDAPTSPPATLIYCSPAFQGHDTQGHPESPERIEAITRTLAQRGMLQDRVMPPFELASREALLTAHEAAFIDWLLELEADQQEGWIDGDTWFGRDSLQVARLAAGAGLAAVDTVLSGAARSAFVLARPPGHHATPHRAMGFCLLNTVAIAARRALAAGLHRVAIVDPDVHHGNGTQDIFWTDDRVFYASVHQSPLFPGTGAADERGAGKGDGTTRNVPLQAGSGDVEFLAALQEVILPELDAFAPELVLLSAGFDALAGDPIGGLRVTNTGFRTMTRDIMRLAARHADGRIVSVLEGGYNRQTLGGVVADVIETLDASPIEPGLTDDEY